MADTIEFYFNVDNFKDVDIEIKKVVDDAVNKAMKGLVDNFKLLVVDQLVLGASPWKSFTTTASWKWITSPRGLAQLGFSNTIEPLKLLGALQNSFFIKQSNNNGIIFRWANISEIQKYTLHPSAGKLRLPADRSWFEWLYAGAPLREQGYKFKKTGPVKGVRSSAIAGAEAGRMVPGGFWEVPPKFRVDIDRLWERNEALIQRTIVNYLQEKIYEELK